MVASSAMAATIISRPSSLRPSENTRTRGDASATARKYRVTSAVFDSRPMVPGT
jgi:hypothetical protein